MQASSNEARGLLRKWQEENRIIQCRMADGRGSLCGIVGRIENLDEESVLIDARSIYPRGKFIGLTIYFQGAKFSFRGLRERHRQKIWKHSGKLSIRFSSSNSPWAVILVCFVTK